MVDVVNLINRPMLKSDVSWALKHPLTKELRAFVDSCAKRGVPFWNGNLNNNTFSTAGNRFKTLNWYRLWEYASCYAIFVAKYPTGAHFIDLGGAGCYFSYFLASIGYRITIVDIDPYLVEISNATARKLSLENNISCVCKDINVSDLSDIEDADGLYSISVIEHIPEALRIKACSSIYDLLTKRKGYFFLTFDFGDFSSHSIQPVRSLARLSADLEVAGFVIIGNRYSPEMERLTTKPCGPRFHATSTYISTFSPIDPLSDQLKFVLRSVATKMKVPEIKGTLRNFLGIRRADYNFVRLLVQA